MKNTKENVIKLLKEEMKAQYELIKMAQADNNKVKEDILWSEYFGLQHTKFLLEDNKHFNTIWEIFFAGKEEDNE